MARRLELNFPQPIREPKDLYDRHPQLALVQETVRGAGSRIAVIKGERRTGKSSMLRVVRFWARNEPGFDDIYLPRDVSRLRLMKELLEGVAVKSDSSLTRLGYADDDGRLRFSTWQEFEAVAGELTAGTGKTYVVCLDEFDSMLNNLHDQGQSAEANQILDFVLDITDSDLPFKFVVTLTRTTPHIARADATPFTSVAPIAELTPWTPAESREFVDQLVRTAFVVSDGAHEVIADYGGGHPYFIKAILHGLLMTTSDSTSPTNVSVQDMHIAIAAALDTPEINQTLPNIVSAHFTAEERALLGRLAVAPVSASDPAIRPEVVSELVRRHYACLVADTYVLTHGLFGAWLRREALTAGPGPGSGSAVIPRPRDAVTGSQPRLRIDEGRRMAFVGELEIKLSPSEFRFLNCMAQHAGVVLDRQAVSAAVWDDKANLDGQEGRLYALVRRVREKLGPVAATYIETRQGFGFYARPADVEWIPGGQQ